MWLYSNRLTLNAPTPLASSPDLCDLLSDYVIMDVARYLYLIILMDMMENLLLRTASMTVTYVHTLTHIHTHNHTCVQPALTSPWKQS